MLGVLGARTGIPALWLSLAHICTQARKNKKLLSYPSLLRHTALCAAPHFCWWQCVCQAAYTCGAMHQLRFLPVPWRRRWPCRSGMADEPLLQQALEQPANHAKGLCPALPCYPPPTLIRHHCTQHTQRHVIQLHDMDDMDDTVAQIWTERYPERERVRVYVCVSEIEKR